MTCDSNGGLRSRYYWFKKSNILILNSDPSKLDLDPYNTLLVGGSDRWDWRQRRHLLHQGGRGWRRVLWAPTTPVQPQVSTITATVVNTTPAISGGKQRGTSTIHNTVAPAASVVIVIIITAIIIIIIHLGKRIVIVVWFWCWVMLLKMWMFRRAVVRWL